MKTLIVSIAVILFGITSLAFHWDLTNMQQMEAHLRAATESCALCGAVAYSQEENVLDAVENYVNKLEESSSLFSKGDLQVESCMEDENKVIVTLSFQAKKGLFRLPDMGINRELTHTSCYAFETYSE